MNSRMELAARFITLIAMKTQFRVGIAKVDASYSCTKIILKYHYTIFYLAHATILSDFMKC